MKIIADENIPFVQNCFGSAAEVVTVGGRKITADIVKNADALLVRSITKVDEKLLAGSNVRFVGTATIGLEHIDVDYLAKKNIAFASAPGSNANSVAEYVVSAILNLAEKHNFDFTKKSIGIIGCGNVGSRVAIKAAAIGLKVVLNDPPLQRKTGEAKYRPLEEIFGCDIITLHTPLTKDGRDKTFHLADEKFFKSLKKGAIFINSSRGKVHETAALKKALQSGMLSAAVLDVWENEPDIDIQLLQAVDYGTPHIAGYSYDGKVAGMIMIYERFCRHFNLEIKNSIETFLPTPQISKINIDAEQKNPLLYAVGKLYDIADDDAALRKISDLPAEKRGAYFDGLRKNYRIRREFQNTAVCCEDEKSMTALQGIGFAVSRGRNGLLR